MYVTICIFKSLGTCHLVCRIIHVIQKRSKTTYIALLPFRYFRGVSKQKGAKGDRKLRCLCKSFLRTAAARCRIAESVSVMEAHQVLLVQDTKRGKEKESNILESLFSVIDKPRSPVPKLEKDMKRLKGKAKPPMRELESLLRQPQNN